jgi:dephospho-CoA kinase
VTKYLFDKTLDLCEFELFEAWSRFKQKHSDKPYIIFESSIIFERKWQSKFSGTICVFAPKEERVRRARELTFKRIDEIWNNIETEISEFDKNSASTWIVHNYEDAPDVFKQINTIDTKIIDLYLGKKSQDLQTF